ncbi:DMT family transporter [Gemmobacter caeruleus]|uniref:DMT family transporter n=1 Tax=Gemmobacter caeruleus TaxID=2595004 RepID=UPI0011EE3A6E|nr:DMT family transporter [Gemmobacter caeruleus]
MTRPPVALLGILCLAAGIAVFSMQDVILKRLSGDYPLHQAMVLRSLAAAPLLFGLAVLSGGARSLIAPGWPRMVLRGLVSFAAYTCYYLALPALPIATTVALYFSAPLMIVVLSVVMLGERVSPARWLAVICGFGGVVVILRPDAAPVDLAAALAIGSGMAYALSMILARIQGGQFSAAAMAFHGNLVFLGLAVGLSLVFGRGGWSAESLHPSLAFLTRGWVMPPARDLALMAACGPIAALGLTLLNQAYRLAPAPMLAPFEYTALIWGLIWGWLIWSDWPDAATWAGIAIIVTAGLVVLWRPGTPRADTATP